MFSHEKNNYGRINKICLIKQVLMEMNKIFQVIINNYSDKQLEYLISQNLIFSAYVVITIFKCLVTISKKEKQHN